MSDIIDVWSATNHCEEEGCHFAFRFENCLSEEEATILMTGVATIHYKSMHPGQFVNLDFEVREGNPFGPYTGEERPN